MKRVPALDGLRGIAITLVVCIHAFGYPAGGAEGVDLFLVLSGYLITTLLMREHARAGHVDLIAFYRRRARRLLPALLVVLAVYFAATQAVFQTVAGLTFTMDITRAWGLGPYGALGHLWSLGIEEQFYLVWPVVLFFVARGRRRWAVAIVVAAIVFTLSRQIELANTGVRVIEGPDTRSLGLAIGCLVALVPFRPSRFVPLVALAVAGLLVANGVPSGIPSLVFCGCAAIVLLEAVSDGSHLATLLSWKPLAALGLISYSLYLWHVPVLDVVGNGSAGRQVAAIAVSLLLACASYRYVERPFIERSIGIRRRPSGRSRRVAASPAGSRASRLHRSWFRSPRSAET